MKQNRISENFSVAEMACQCGCGFCEMDPLFMARLEVLRKRCGDLPLYVTSGCRCKAHDQRVSPKMKGVGPHAVDSGAGVAAVDIRVAGLRAYRVLQEAVLLGFSGVGIRQKGPWEKRIIHLDDCREPMSPRPRVWTY